MAPFLVLFLCVNGGCHTCWFHPGPTCPTCGERGAAITVSMPPVR